MIRSGNLQRCVGTAVLAMAGMLPAHVFAVDMSKCKGAEAAIWDLGGYTDEGKADIQSHIEILNLFPDSGGVREYLHTRIAETRQYQIQSEWDDANRALLTCLAEQRIAEIEREAQAQVVEAEAGGNGGDAEADDRCSAAAAQAANDALADIDARVARFLETPLGKQQGSATPLLQVVMWATSQQDQAIRAGCADSPAFAKRLQELDASYAGAMQACRQLRSVPDTCGPLSPEDTLAKYPFTEADQQRMDEDERRRQEIDWSKLVPDRN